jgi:medium-chain acyl-[acyl-carrier-protein] hydrolase
MDLSSFKSPSYHTHRISVHSYDIDSNSRLNVFSLFNYFQEIAWEHAGILRFGYNDLSENNQFWVLSRIRVEIERLPLWTEQLALITYPRGVDGPFALRDYEVFDSKGERIIAGVSSWLIVNAKTHRPVRPTDLDLTNAVNDHRALTVNASKIADVKQAPVNVDELIVKASDIDVNYHVNNTRYVEWAYNTFSHAYHKENLIKVVEVNFLAEGKEENRLAVERYQLAEKENTIVIKRVDDKKELCRVYFEWM